MDNNKTKVLLIEDNPGDARLIREFLTEAKDAPFNLEHVDCLSKGLNCLAQGGIDAILLDLSLPDSQGLDSLGKILAQTLAVPIVVLSGLKDEAVAIRAVQEGAQDYLVKGNIDSSLLVRSLHYAIERQRLRVALRENEARYRLLADNIADVIWTADLKGRITYVSPSIKNFLGYTVSETLKLEMQNILTPDSAEQAKRLIRDQIALWNPWVRHTPLSLTLEHIHKDSSTLWSDVRLSFLCGEKGNITGILGVTRDITERKKAEEALRKSEALYRLLADNAGDVIWTMDMKGRITYVSPSAKRLLGYSVDEVMALKVEELFTPASAETARKVIKEELAIATTGAQNSPRSILLEHARKDSSTVWVEVMLSSLRDKQGRLIGVQGVTRDITERRKAESALRESEERFRAVFEGTSLGIALVSFDGKALSINPAFEQMLGYKLEEFKQIEGSLRYQHPDDAMADAKLYIEMLKGKREHYTVDKRYIRKDGAVIWGRQNLSVVRDDKGKPKYLIAMIEDITERRLMEEELWRSEERYRELFENANDIIYTHDLTGNFTSINKAGERVTGYKRDEVMSMNISSILSPESLERARQMIARKVEQGGRTQYELEIMTKDGHGVLLEVSTRLIYKEGKPVGIQGIARDITERKKMEQELLRLSDAVRMSSDSITITDLEGKVIDVNEAALKLQGAKSRAELLGMKPYEVIVPEEQEDALGSLAKIVEEGLVKDIQYHVLTRDGRRIFVETSASVMRGAKGEPIGVVAVSRDITERKRMEEALRQSEHDYKVLFESTIDGMFVTDVETVTIAVANQTVAKMCGFDSAEDTVGINPLDLVHPDDKERVLELFMEHVFGKDAQEVHEFRAITKDGRELWLSGMSTRIEYGGKPAVLSSIRDITKQKRAEEEKRKLGDQVQIAGRLAAVGELAAGVAHELNNPITAIKGFAQLLTSKKELDEPLRKDLETIYRESQRAARITQNLLSFARRHEPEKHPISINEALEKTLELRVNQMKFNNIEVEAELDPDLPKTMADFHQMQQVFMNIINNAEQAMIEAHGRGRLLIKTQKLGKSVQITFADDGPGIPEDDLKRVFDPFFTTKEVGKGTGLGLSICYGLVEAHGGRIYARSKLGEGATFIVEMPIISENQPVAEAALVKPAAGDKRWKKREERY